MAKRKQGGVPRQTTIGGQRHDLAYINPFEADLLRAYGGSGEPGPGGIPAYRGYNAGYNPGTVSRDRTSSRSSYSPSTRPDRTDPNRSSSSGSSYSPSTRPDRTDPNRSRSSSSSSSSRSSSSSSSSSTRPDRTDPNRPSPAEQVARANAQANAERARQRAQQADRQREQQMRAREAAAAEARRKQAEQSRREAAAAEARQRAQAAARAEQARIAQAEAAAEAARLARIERNREIALHQDPSTSLKKSTIRQQEIARRLSERGVDGYLGAAEGAVPLPETDTSGIMSAAPISDPSASTATGDDATFGSNVMNFLEGLPGLGGIISGVIDSVKMGYDAGGPLVSFDEQRANLEQSGKYSAAEIEEYMRQTKEGFERQQDQMFGGGAPSGDDDGPRGDVVPADPCPEGFVMDAESGVCVPVEDDVEDPVAPVAPVAPVTPIEVDPVEVEVGSSDYLDMTNPYMPTPLQPYGAPSISEAPIESVDPFDPYNMYNFNR